MQAGDETFKAISEFVDPKHIPTDYGGSLTCGTEPDSCRWHSPEETALREVCITHTSLSRTAEEEHVCVLSPHL
jgi:hypothetical protein